MLQKSPDNSEPSWMRFRTGALLFLFVAVAAVPFVATLGVYEGSTAPYWGRVCVALINSYFFSSLLFDHIQRVRVSRRDQDDDSSNL